MVPFIEPGSRPSSTNAFKTLISSIVENIPIFNWYSITVITDSAFSTKDAVAYCLKNNIHFLLSLNKYSKSALEILKKKLSDIKIADVSLVHRVLFGTLSPLEAEKSPRICNCN